MKSSLTKHFDYLAKGSKIGHAFLIGNISFESIEEELYKILDKHIFQSKNNSNKLDVYLIKPESSTITKSQIMELRKDLTNTSQFHEKKVYIIDETEKLNLSSANSLLKTLEEPPVNVYAFLISRNIDKIVETVRSRCQIIFLSSSEQKVLNEEVSLKAIEFIKKFEDYGSKVIAYSPDTYKMIKDRDEFKKILEYSILLYKDCLNFLLKRDLEWYNISESFISYVASKNELNKLYRKNICLNEVLNDIDLNININLIIDRIAIEFGRC